MRGREVHTHLQPRLQIGGQVGTYIVTLESRADISTLIIQVAQRDVIFRGLATTGNASAQIGIVSILGHGILPAVIPKGVSAGYQITILVDRLRISSTVRVDTQCLYCVC